MSDKCKPYHFTPFKARERHPEAPECNPKEAPEGYYAMPKPQWTDLTGNLCRKCDFRPTCQKQTVEDGLAYGRRCSHIGVIHDGKTYQREDKCSVIFKKLPEGSQP